MTRAARIAARLDGAIDLLLEHCGSRIVCATPLGLGKPTPLLNALYARVKQDESLHLTLVTALSLAVPSAGSELERRFLEPFARRVFEGVPSLDYLDDLARERLPSNVEILEFYLRPGSMLGNATMQRHYISANYTHVARDVVKLGCNVIMVMVAERDGRYSLSCNPDLTLDAVRLIGEANRECVVIALVNRQLPFMPNDAEVNGDFFDVIVDAPEFEQRLFGVPNTPADTADHAVGVYAAALVKDGGTLQLGIGSLGDAVAHWLRVREHDANAYADAARALDLARYRALVDTEGGTGAFRKGLFGASEMFTWGLMTLFDAGVMKRKVYDDIGLQRALNAGAIGDPLPPDALERLHATGAIADPLTEHDIAMLLHFGLLREIPPTGTPIADIPATARGTALANGQVLHAAFFLGPEDFYARLRALTDDERALFNMTAVSKVNDLFGEEELEREQRQHARFINICMKMTLFGAAVSDAIEDNRVVSGVGGQYNFVAMAHELHNARSILCLRATRESHGKPESNIVFNYGHVTIPRHLRDIVITEYGIADLRGRTDEDCARAMIEIADSRFQPELVAAAKRAGKLAVDYEVPAYARNNTSEALRQRMQELHARDLLPRFPLGTDFDPVEQRLLFALTALKSRTANVRGKAGVFLRALTVREQVEDHAPLVRMGLADPSGFRERLLRRLVLAGFRLSETANR